MGLINVITTRTYTFSLFIESLLTYFNNKYKWKITNKICVCYIWKESYNESIKN